MEREARFNEESFEELGRNCQRTFDFLLQWAGEFQSLPFNLPPDVHMISLDFLVDYLWGLLRCLNDFLVFSQVFMHFS